MEKKYSIGSLFAGIGGFELGLERAIPGAYTLWQVEQEKYCKKVLSKHWPEATIYDDVRNITKNNTKQVDILCGGFPCQDISLAGKGEGLHGKKSGLWWEMHRIINELQPKAVIMENVAAINIRGLGAVLGSLSEIGYDAEWCTIRASDFGAPHRRARWFCIAYPKTIGFYVKNERSMGKENPSRVFNDRWTSTHSNQDRQRTSNPIQSRRQASNVHDTEGLSTHSSCKRSQNEPINTEQTHRKTSSMPKYCSRRDDTRGLSTYSISENNCKRDVSSERVEKERNYENGLGFIDRSSPILGHNEGRGYWEQFPTTSPICRRDDGIPYRVDRIRALGNAIVPQCSEWIGRKLWESGILQSSN